MRILRFEGELLWALWLRALRMFGHGRIQGGSGLSVHGRQPATDPSLTYTRIFSSDSFPQGCKYSNDEYLAQSIFMVSYMGASRNQRRLLGVPFT